MKKFRQLISGFAVTFCASGMRHVKLEIVLAEVESSNWKIFRCFCQFFSKLNKEMYSEKVQSL